MVYGDRIRYGSRTDSSNDDLYIMSETVDKYILGYPWHLEDGTISRPYSWNDEGLIELQGKVRNCFFKVLKCKMKLHLEFACKLQKRSK